MANAICLVDPPPTSTLPGSSVFPTRCVDPDVEPTVVIPVALLERLVAETANGNGIKPAPVPSAPAPNAVPRFEVCELADAHVEVADDADAWEVAFDGMVSEPFPV